MKCIGILGGTFNPVHFAHLAMADAALTYRFKSCVNAASEADAVQFGLDEVWFMPSKHPPHKSGKDLASEEHRCRMLSLAIADNPSYVLSDFELRHEGTTYTADTLARLKKEYPDDRFYFIIGGDSFFQIESWYRPEQILQQVRLMVAGRNAVPSEKLEEHAGYLTRKYEARIYLMDMPDMPVSSSDIRRAVREGRSISHAVPERVEEYIRKHRLYQDGTDS